jgi:hypothetical protein
VVAFGLRIGEASPLKAQGRDHVIAGAQLVLPPASRGLDPEKLFARCLGNGSHLPSLKNKPPR